MFYAKAMIFVDAENLLLRYQAMLANGSMPKGNVVHQPDRLIWSPDVTRLSEWALMRVHYYVSTAGDDQFLDALSHEIKSVQYKATTGTGFLNPHVFKKQKRGEKTKSVDINLVTDLLRHTYNKSCQVALVLSGDGDYLPSLREAMRQGVQVWVGAFSSGLDRRLRRDTDEFFDLDSVFFVTCPHK